MVLNVFQTDQYVMTYIRQDGMTRDFYWSVSGRPYIPDEERELIMEDAAVQHPRSRIREP